MFTIILFWAATMIFLLKILGNLALAYGTLSLKEGEQGTSVLLPFILDLIFLILLTVLGWILGAKQFPYGGLAAFLWALGIILFSYFHYFVVLTIGNWKKKRK